jgi:hypothetical protein
MKRPLMIRRYEDLYFIFSDKTNKRSLFLDNGMREFRVLLAFILLPVISGIASGNSPPENIIITGIPQDGRIENPLNATISFEDPDGDNVSVTWLLDGEEIGKGYSIIRYIYPGRKNLTAVLDDNNGSVIQVSRIVDPVPPPGWGDKPDNRRNELIFWTIFGSGGLIFALAAAWIWLKKEKDR